MKYPKTLVVVTALLLAVVNMHTAGAKKILAVEFFSSKSHKLTYISLLEQLGQRGHEVTILTPIPPAKQMKNVKEVVTLDLDVYSKKMFDVNVFRMKESNENINPFLMVDFFSKFCEDTYDLPQVQAILKEDFDLVFLQPLLNDCVLGLVYRLKAPLILFSPVSVYGFQAEQIGNHFPPSFIPNVFLGFPDEMTFHQRFINFGVSVLIEGILRFYWEPTMERVYRNKLGSDIPSAREILANASIILSNGHFTLHKPKPYFPDIVDVGGIHSHPANPLPKELEDFIRKGKDGFIYFSMGTGIKGAQMPEEKRKMILKVFSKLKQQVIWKWETETMPDLPRNVKLIKWAPQQDLLGHKDIKLFITHCGGGSTEEAIYHGVPLIGIPMFGDQPLNAKLAQGHGFIIELDWTSLTDDLLHSGIQEILTNATYRDNVKKLSVLYKDQPDDPMKRGIYWVEYVMRHQGAPHLQNVGRKLSYLQYHSYDVIFTYFVLLTAMVYVTFAILWCTIRKCCHFSTKGSSIKSKSE